MANKILVISPKSKALSFDFSGIWLGLARIKNFGLGLGLVNIGLTKMDWCENLMQQTLP